jgi:hypothetical protein
MKNSLAALASIVAVSAAAVVAPPVDPVAAQPARPAPACFWVRNVTNFAANDTTTVYLKVGFKQVWELKLFANCFNLDWVHHLALRSRGVGSNICEGPNPGLDVVVRDIGIGRQSCPVTEVRKLTPDEVAALPKNAQP